MKTFLSLLTIVFFASCSTTSVIQVPANQSVSIETNEFEYSKVKLRNRSIKGIDVKVVNKESGEFIRGFGLGSVGSAHVSVEDFGQLQLINNSNSAIKVGYSVSEKTISKKAAKEAKPKKEKEQNSASLQLYLTNKSAKSIPLQIPSVMNPNLSPFSKSGVRLEMGQKIFFKNKGKKYLLLQVTDELQNEQTIEVSNLIKKRKAELGL